MALEHQEFKLVVLGSGGVGKSALTIRMVTDNFLENYDPTIEDTYRKQIVVDDEPALLDILDTAGQEEFACMRDQWIRDGDGFVLVYTIIKTGTFNEVKTLYEHISRIKEDDFLVVLCGNMCDLADQRQVDYQQGQTLASEWDCPFYETSAKTKLNSEAPFIELIRKIRQQRKAKGLGVKERKKVGLPFPCLLL